MFLADKQALTTSKFWYTNGIILIMLLAISHMTGLDLQLGIMAVLGGNLAFIIALTTLTRVREKMMSRLIGF